MNRIQRLEVRLACLQLALEYRNLAEPSLQGLAPSLGDIVELARQFESQIQEDSRWQAKGWVWPLRLVTGRIIEWFTDAPYFERSAERSRAIREERAAASAAGGARSESNR